MGHRSLPCATGIDVQTVVSHLPGSSPKSVCVDGPDKAEHVESVVTHVEARP